MNKWVSGRQPNSLPVRLNVKSMYLLRGMQLISRSSSNNGPVETKTDKAENLKPEQKNIYQSRSKEHQQQIQLHNKIKHASTLF